MSGKTQKVRRDVFRSEVNRGGRKVVKGRGEERRVGGFLSKIVNGGKVVNPLVSKVNFSSRVVRRSVQEQVRVDGKVGRRRRSDFEVGKVKGNRSNILKTNLASFQMNKREFGKRDSEKKLKMEDFEKIVNNQKKEIMQNQELIKEDLKECKEEVENLMKNIEVLSGHNTAENSMSEESKIRWTQ